LVSEEAAKLRCIAAELAGVTRGLNGRGVLSEPSFQRGPELEDREQQWHQDRDRERRLERGETAFVLQRFRQRTVCIWLTSA
jgi:hypothetical protein